jgi:hypothetical protein
VIALRATQAMHEIANVRPAFDVAAKPD